MNVSKTRQVVLTSRPVGIPQREHFAIRTSELPALTEGQLLIRNTYLSVEPAMRGWVNAAANYAEPVAIGDVMRSFAVGEVIESRHPSYRVGDVVMGMFGWQDYAVVDTSAVWRTVRETDLPQSLALGVLGMNGLTAWAGVRRVLRPEAGSTVVVSSAAGSVGSAVGQLVARMGCRTVGIAGSPMKASRCVEEFGFDVGLDYRSDTFEDDLAAACTEGVDGYFDNTSGKITDAVLRRLNPHSSVVVCGTAAISSWDPWPQGPRVERILLTQRARMEGFLVFDHLDLIDEAAAGMAELVRAGDLAYNEHILEGIESAPGAIAMLYAGENTGKLLIRLP